MTRPRGCFVASLLAMTTQTDRCDWVTSARSEIPERFLDFSRPCSQENFPPPPAVHSLPPDAPKREVGADFSSASSDFKALGAFFWDFVADNLVSIRAFLIIH